MGLFSSSSRSYSTTQNFDRRIAAESSIVAAEGSNVTVESITPEALKAVSDLGTDVLNVAATAQKESARLSEAALNRAFDSTAGGSADLVRQAIVFGAIAAVGIVLARAAPKFLRG